MSGVALGLAITASILVVLGAGAQVTRTALLRTAGFGGLLLGWLLLLLAVLPASLAERRPLVVLALLIGCVGAWRLGPRLRRREHWLLAFAAGSAIFRVPVPVGDGDNAMLLLPIYAAIGIGAVAALRERLETVTDPASDGLDVDRGRATRLLDLAVCLQPAIAAASLLWSEDRAATAGALAFFLVPFLLGYLLLRRAVRSGAQLVPATWALLTGVGVAAVVGLVQATTHEVWWNPKVIDANRFRGDFRTNSLFWDPNIFGRGLVYGILALVAIAVVGRYGRRGLPALVVGSAVLLGALWTTYSQSSWFALAAALAVLGVFTLPPRLRRWVAGAIVVACLVATPAAVDALRGRDASGRLEVVRAGIDLAQERPLLGFGAGAFETAAVDAARADGRYASRLTASHTTPITVAAELGVVGFAAYLLLLATAVATILARWRRSSTPAAAARGRGDTHAGPGWPTAPVVWATAVVVALVAHSLLYAAFFEDPLLWGALAILACLPAVDRTGSPIE